VPRWQQIDAASFAVAEAWHRWRAAGVPAAALAPGVFLVANQRASNDADAAFVRAGAFSPARFVATLPSVTLAAMLQTTGWEGPMLCVQAGERTLVSALIEAADLASDQGEGAVGVVTHAQRGPDVAVTYLVLGHRPFGERVAAMTAVPTGPDAARRLCASDAELHAWLESGPSSRLSLSPHWELER
jgi:hypothetical protein